MGAMEFQTIGHGMTAQEAFEDALRDALYEHGHGGYTGTIAEKDSYRVVPLPNGEDPYKFSMKCMEDEDHFCQDKWGDAACVKISDEEFLFFGWASS